MNSNRTQLDPSQLQTPRDDRTAVIEPPFDDVPELVAENLRSRPQLHDYDLQGQSLAEVSLQARAELVAAARRWTGAYRNVKKDDAGKGDSPIFAETKIGTVPSASPSDPGGLIFLAGHQPQMFHPGVWFKNFALGTLARRHHATAINLIIDGDTLSDTSVRVPGGSVASPQAAPIPFDRADPNIPYEERTIEDHELFASFGRRAIERMAPLVADPLLERYWPLVQAQSRQSDNLGACLARACHRLEGEWGLDTLEVPQSWLCSGEAFQWFAAHLLARLPEFRDVYNESLQAYRRTHRVRNVAHPAPDLAEDGPWLEAPLWVWTAENPRRRRLFAKNVSGEIILSDRQSWEARLPLTPEGDAARAVERLLELQRRGVRIRPRALATTLWARLALGDLFLHGIGGAKYDRVTDRLIERFFRMTPPRFLVVSATLHLPIERPPAAPDDVRAIQRELRAMTYQPERYLTGDSPSGETELRPRGYAELISEKQRWIAIPQTVENARQRCQAIRRFNAALQPWLDNRRQRLTERLAEMSRRVQAESVLASREYAFCLYPEATLRGFLSQLLRAIA